MCVVAFEAAQLTVKEEDQRAEILAVLGMVSYQDGQLEDAKAFLFQWSVTVTSSNGLSCKVKLKWPVYGCLPIR